MSGTADDPATRFEAAVARLAAAYRDAAAAVRAMAYADDPAAFKLAKDLGDLARNMEQAATVLRGEVAAALYRPRDGGLRALAALVSEPGGEPPSEALLSRLITNFHRARTTVTSPTAEQEQEGVA